MLKQFYRLCLYFAQNSNVYFKIFSSPTPPLNRFPPLQFTIPPTGATWPQLRSTVLGENVRIFNSLFQGNLKSKEMNPIFKAFLKFCTKIVNSLFCRVQYYDLFFIVTDYRRIFSTSLWMIFCKNKKRNYIFKRF